MPLQDIPQKFSSMQAWHTANPHRQVQLNGVKAWQHAQGVSFLRRNRDLLAGRRFTESGMFNLDTFVHDHINSCICQYIRCFLTDNAQLHPENLWMQSDGLTRMLWYDFGFSKNIYHVDGLFNLVKGCVGSFSKQFLLAGSDRKDGVPV